MNDSVTKSKFDNLYGIRESLPDGIKRATDIMMAGKVCVVCGYGRCGQRLSNKFIESIRCKSYCYGDRPINALQAAMEGYEVKTLEDVASMAQIVVTYWCQ